MDRQCYNVYDIHVQHMEFLQTELFNCVRGLVQPEVRVRINSIEDSKVYKKRTTICIQRKFQWIFETISICSVPIQLQSIDVRVILCATGSVLMEP